MHERAPARPVVLAAIFAGLVAGVAVVGCTDDAADTSSGAGAASSAAGDAGAGPSTGSGATGGSAATGSGAGGTGGEPTSGCGPGDKGVAMPLISRDAPAFASDGSGADTANDDAPNTSWTSGSVPAWLAYDLSAVPATDRQQVLVAWYSIHAPCYIDTGTPSSGQRPIDYVIEASDAPGGASPPASGWTELVSVKDSRYCGRQHLVDLKGANWIRMSIAKGSDDGTTVSFDLDVQSAPNGACDSWLFMGDSITYMTMTHAFCDLPSLVSAAKPAYWPAAIDAALGGTNTSTAMEIIDDTMMDFPGRFVALAYGTNDHANELHMEELVQHVIAAGKVPVVPHMPWSDGSMDGPAINQAIDALYAKYPEIVPGPDLWAFFEGRTDLIPSGDVHPNAEGQEELRKQWAAMMAGMNE